MKTFSLRVRDEQYAKLKSISNEKGRSMNKQIEQLIQQYIKDYEKVNGKIEVEEE